MSSGRSAGPTCKRGSAASFHVGTLLEVFAGRRQLIVYMHMWHHLLDLTPYGRQETWEDSPDGCPQPYDPSRGAQFRSNGRPTAQWARLDAGFSDDLR